MKKDLIIVIILISIIYYIAGAFNAAAFDISSWSDDSRNIISTCWLCTVLFVSGVYIITDSEI